MINPITQVGNHLKALIFPKLCYLCNSHTPLGDNNFCIHCTTNFPYSNHFKVHENEAYFRLAGRFDFVVAKSLIQFYENTDVQWMMHNIKYQGRKDIASYLGKMAGEKWLNTNVSLPKIDAIVPVPLHPFKRKLRGYNQAEIMANGIGEVLNAIVIPNILQKTINTNSQTRLSRMKRINNVIDSFSLSDNTENLLGKHILLVDDVLTTGATLEACGRQLELIPNIKLSVLTICIVMR